MKRYMIATLAVALFAMALPAFAANPTVQGKVIDQQGQPVADAKVKFENPENGNKFEVTTSAKGEYQRINVFPGVYNVSITGKDGKNLLNMKGVAVRFEQDVNQIDFDFAKIAQAASKAGGPQPSEADEKKIEEAKKTNATIGNLNNIAAQASQLQKDGDAATDPTVKSQKYAQAIPLWEQLVAGQKQLPAGTVKRPEAASVNLANAALALGDMTSKTDPSQAKENYGKAADAYQQAITLNPATPEIGALHNNLGQALAKSGDAAGALKEFKAAAQASPTTAAQFYFNAGATLVNMSLKETDQQKRADDLNGASEMLDKAIAVKPDYADAYFLKGQNLVSQAKTDASGKITVPPGTVEAFNKYLELAPDGPHAAEAKGNIEFLGGKVETKFSSKPKPATKK